MRTGLGIQQQTLRNIHIRYGITISGTLIVQDHLIVYKNGYKHEGF